MGYQIKDGVIYKTSPDTMLGEEIEDVPLGEVVDSEKFDLENNESAPEEIDKFKEEYENCEILTKHPDGKDMIWEKIAYEPMNDEQTEN